VSIKNKIRTVLKIRKERAVPPAGPMPQIGSSIVCNRLRIRLKYPINREIWEWFSKHGWRAVDMRTERREYTLLPDRALEKLINLDVEQRDILHTQIMQKYSVSRATTDKTEKARKSEPSAASNKSGKEDQVSEQVS